MELIVKNKEKEKLNYGDIVTFSNNKGYLVSRVNDYTCLIELSGVNTMFYFDKLVTVEQLNKRIHEVNDVPTIYKKEEYNLYLIEK